MLLVSLLLERTVVPGVDQLHGGGVEDVTCGTFDLRREVVEKPPRPGEGREDRCPRGP